MSRLASVCLLAALSAGSAVAGGIDEPLRTTLLKMAADDQEAIRIATANPTRELNESESKEVDRINRRNGERIRGIVREHGWPGRSLVGDDGASAAWLVAQHMDYDVAFQRSCLDLMKESFEAGEVSPTNLAYLTDRVLTHEGKKQMYGTQGMGVFSAEDEARIDLNRATIGLEPWRAAVEKRKKVYANGYGAAAEKSP